MLDLAYSLAGLLVQAALSVYSIVNQSVIVGMPAMGNIAVDLTG